MVTLLSIKRIASRLLKKGINKIRIKQEEVPRASEALTAEDVRSMIKDKVIYATPKQGVSRARAKVKHAQVKKYSRISTKELWMRKVRTQRKKLKELYDNGLLDSQTRKKLYYMIKGNMFKSKNAFMTYINEHKMLKDKNKGD